VTEAAHIVCCPIKSPRSPTAATETYGFPTVAALAESGSYLGNSSSTPYPVIWRTLWHKDIGITN